MPAHPTLNAMLNLTSAVLLVLGYRAIRRRKVRLHARWMLSAFAVSTLFLLSYVVYHATQESRRYPGTGVDRAVYLVLLASHVVLAMALVPLALRALYLAVGRRFRAHRRLARWVFPLWLYVSVTGVVVYVFLYVF